MRLAKLEPTYKDATKIVNKVTIAPHKKNELTILLDDYVGRDGWVKDARLINYGVQLQEWAEISQATMIQKISSDEEFLEIANIAFNEQIPLDKYQLMDVIAAFQEAMFYRMGRTEEPAVKEAKKN